MKKREVLTGQYHATRPAIGLEAEFVCVVDGKAVDPADEFGDPRAFLGDGAMHRVGTSYHLGTGGAVYFDTGVIEVVTPLIDLGPAGAGRAARALWEGIAEVRDALDRWCDREGCDARLVGFSTHYSVSLPELSDAARIRDAAWVLAHMIPFPVMLLATNRESTGVGLRPRPGRIELTVDFTPDSLLMAGVAAVFVAAVREVASWDTIDLAELERRSFPVVADFSPIPHTSRKGWLAHRDCYRRNPFTTPPGAAVWRTWRGDVLSMRGIARRVVMRLLPRIRQVAQPSTVRLLGSVLSGRLASFLDQPERPSAYLDVGRACAWREPDPRRTLEPSEYERVMRSALAGEPILVEGREYRPEGTEGWTRIRYRDGAGRSRLFTVEELAGARHLPRRRRDRGRRG